MSTRKEFCLSCLAMALAGLGAPLAFARQGDEVKKEKDSKKEKAVVGACGIVCSTCPAYIATRTNDDSLRAKTAQEWSEMFKADIKAENINCDGCPSNGPRLFAHCLECGIRKCAREKKLANCAACPEYACSQLQEFFAMVPQARETLEELRKL